MSESMDRNLKFHERMAIHGHILVCKGCHHIKKQLSLVGTAIKHQRELAKEISAEDLHLSPEAKARIKQRLTDSN